jgi:hypothetical protein
MFAASPGAIVVAAAALSSVVFWLDTLTDDGKDDVTSWGSRPAAAPAAPLALAAPAPVLTAQVPPAKPPTPKTKAPRAAIQPQA